MSHHTNGGTSLPLFGLIFGGSDATSAAMGQGGVPASYGLQAAGMGAAGGTLAGGAGGHRPHLLTSGDAAPPQGSAATPSVSITPAFKGLETSSLTNASGSAFGGSGFGGLGTTRK